MTDSLHEIIVALEAMYNSKKLIRKADYWARCAGEAAEYLRAIAAGEYKRVVHAHWNKIGPESAGLTESARCSKCGSTQTANQIFALPAAPGWTERTVVIPRFAVTGKDVVKANNAMNSVYTRPKRVKKIAYCTYHSCIISSKMAASHRCFHKSNSKQIRRCKYLVLLGKENSK